MDSRSPPDIPTSGKKTTCTPSLVAGELRMDTGRCRCSGAGPHTAPSSGFPLDVGAAADYAVYLQLSRLGAVAFKDRVVVSLPAAWESNMSRDPVLMPEVDSFRIRTRATRSAGGLPGRVRRRQDRLPRGVRANKSLSGLRRSARTGSDRHWRATISARARPPPPLSASIPATCRAEAVARVVRGVPLHADRTGPVRDAD